MDLRVFSTPLDIINIPSLPEDIIIKKNNENIIKENPSCNNKKMKILYFMNLFKLQKTMLMKIKKETFRKENILLFLTQVS